MSRRQEFFTVEMGARLRQLRESKGLTQEQLAERMGLRGKGRGSLIARLERGKISNPTLRFVTYYLRASSALFSEFYDLLTRVELLPVDTAPIQKTEFPQDRKERIIAQTVKQVQKYQSRVECPLDAAPMKPEKQRKATIAFREYRMQVNIIEQAVVELLEREATQAIAEKRPIPVRYYDYYKYKLLARRILSVVRKYGSDHEDAKTSIGPENIGFKHQDTKALTGSENIGESGDNHEETKTQKGSENFGEAGGAPEDTTCRAHLLTPSLSSERRGSGNSHDREAEGRRPNPRKKTLEQRLDEAMSFVGEAQLNADVAAKVRELVLKRYADRGGVLGL